MAYVDDHLPFSSLVPKIAQTMDEYPERPKLFLNFTKISGDFFKRCFEAYSREVISTINTVLIENKEEREAKDRRHR